jgi:lipid II:glycine glycyltransferase (peptidoglycan interpeptide bridge formation enzyme)
MPVASILTLTHKKSMTYKYGCSDPQQNRLGGVALLFWKAIEEASEKGYVELDMGRSDVSNAGLIAFKEHWSAARFPLTYWRYPTAPPGRGIARNARAVGPVFLRAPEWSLKIAGRLLYRHIG